ncbi:MAG: hypothetical protein AB7E76_07385 [Deferribacterales bacterium]|jgi:hypothetical protein
MRTLNRRNFIKGAVAVSGMALCSTATMKSALAAETPAEQQETPILPWGYQELDPEYVRKLGHLGYYLEECGGGAFWAIITAMREKTGYPFTLIPSYSKEDFMEHLETGSKKHMQIPMQYAAGGVAGYGTLCGAPNGAASAMTYMLPMNVVDEIVPRLLRYYETESFPTNESNTYASSGEFFPPKYKSANALPQSCSSSVLCHVSVGKWCEKSGYASGAKERSERCARVTGDIAAMAVKLMNAHVKGELHTAFPMHLSHDTAGCKTCHSKGDKYESGQFTRGSMECGSCHDDKHDKKMDPHKGENRLQTAFGTKVNTWAGAAVVGTISGIGVHAVNKRAKKGKDHEDND